MRWAAILFCVCLGIELLSPSNVEGGEIAFHFGPRFSVLNC